MSAAGSTDTGSIIGDALSAILSAGGADVAALAAANADTGTRADRLMATPIPITQIVLDGHLSIGTKQQPTGIFGGPWAFWFKWYDRAIAGEPLPWDLQEKVALIPDVVWNGGLGAVASEIERIEAEYWARALPQAEVLIVDEDGRFDVRPEQFSIDDRLERILQQVQFSRDLAMATNCGFNPMCVAAKYLAHILDVVRDDPNTIEQHLRQASNLLKQKLQDGDYAPDDALRALIDGLDQHALQMRANFPEVREAYDLRLQQKLRETDDKMLRMVAGGMREFQREKTIGRLFAESGLDAETVERDEGVKAMATAIQRTGGRAAAANLIERASQTAKNVDGSGGYKAAQIGTTGWSLVGMLKDLFGG